MAFRLKLGKAFIEFGEPKRKRAFEAAKGSRFTGDFLATDGPADRDLKRNAKALRERARTLETDDGYVEGILNELESNVVGKQGIIVTPKARKRDQRAVGGMLDAVDTRACEKIANAWAEFSKKGNYEVTRQHSRAQMERLAIRSCARDGEFFKRIVAGFPNNDHRFAIQGIEADALDFRYSDDQKNIHMGIQFDEWDGRIAYHFDKVDRSDTLQIPKKETFDADDILHLFAAKRATQSRGYSWLAPVLLRLRHLGKFEESEVIMARYGAMKIGFFKNTGEQIYDGEEDEEGNIKAPTTPGEWEVLPAGFEPHHIDPSHPNSNYPDFRKAMLRGICASLPVNYNTLAKDLEGVSFSSIRQGTLSERDQYRVIQNWFIEGDTQPVFDRWLEMALTMRLIDGLNVEDYQRACHADFSGRSWDWVDPLKDIKAAKEEIMLGINSRQAVTREKGRSFTQKVEENKEDVEKLNEAGLPASGEDAKQNAVAESAGVAV